MSMQPRTSSFGLCPDPTVPDLQNPTVWLNLNQFHTLRDLPRFLGTVVGVIDGQRCGGYGIGDIPRYLIAGPDRFQCPGTAKESPYFGQGAFPLDDFIFQGWQQLPINLRKSVEPYYNTMDENQVQNVLWQLGKWFQAKSGLGKTYR